MNTPIDLVREHYANADRGDLDASIPLFAPDVETLTPQGALKGREAFKAMGEAFRTAFSDTHHELVRCYQDGDTVIAEGLFTGQHTGPMATPDGTLPPSGQTVSFTFADFWQVRDGVCVSHRLYWDNVALMAQMSPV